MTTNNYSNKIAVIGHRGAMGHVAENTIESIQKAIDLKVDMIEIDVFKIKSGELMVFHDSNLERLTSVKGNIEDFTLEELEKVLVQGKYKIPTLREVITVIDRKVILNIELKGVNTAIDTSNIIDEFKIQGWNNTDFIISSFIWDELELIYNKNKKLNIAVLTEDKPEDAIDFAKKINAVAINPHFKTLDGQNVLLIKNANLKIYPWTVNEIEDIQRMKDLKVDGIITNFPERIKEVDFSLS